MTTPNVIINNESGSEKTPKVNTLFEQQEVPTTTLFGQGTAPGIIDLPADVETSGEMDLSSADRAKGLIRGLTLILQHHGAPRTVIDSFKAQTMAYLDIEDEAVFFKRAKYLTVAPMAKFLNRSSPGSVESPKIPDKDLNWSGQWKNWARTRTNVYCRRNIHLWYSFLQGKRAALPLSDALVLTTYEEHRKAMEIKDPIDDCTLEGVMEELEPVLAKVAKRLQRQYRGGLTHEEHMEMYSDYQPRETRHVASTRACFETSRAKGGQMGYLKTLVPGVSAMDPRNRASQRVIPDLVRMTFLPMAVIAGEVRTNVVIEEYGYPDGERMWRDNILGEAIKFTGGVRLKATIQAVLEPLKVRVISKGNAVPYYLSKPLQKAVHDIMREMPCFKLIGKPLCPTDLIALAENRTILGDGQYEWFSIDYSAATDKLSAALSAAIMNRLLIDQDEEIRTMWLSVLAPHECRYPYPYSEKVKPVMQVNGQLMGSILSFPILCLANLGLYLYNIKDDTRPLRDKLNGVLVNGDDMLYVAKRSMWNTHVEIGNKVGLTMSPGKAYHHPSYANANSACYHYPLDQRRATPFSIPFLNVGLYFGQGKVLGGTDVDSERTVCSVIDRLVMGALPGKGGDILAGYINRHSKAIGAECQGRNLFIAKSLGGMGCTIPDGFDFNVTPAQRAYAAYLYDKNPYAHLGLGPMPARSVSDAPTVLKAPWLDGIDELREQHHPISSFRRLVEKPKESKPKFGDVPVRLMKKSDLFQDFHLCALRRPGARGYSKPYRNRNFLAEWRHDLLFEALEDLCEESSEEGLTVHQ